MLRCAYVDWMIRYRDPNCSKTAHVFQSCAEWAAEARFTDDDVAQVLPLHPVQPPTMHHHSSAPQAKLSLFSSIDAPLPPSSRGLSLFANGLSDESRQRFRDGAVQCTCTVALLSRSRAPGLLSAERVEVAAACAQLLQGGVVCAAGPEDGCVGGSGLSVTRGMREGGGGGYFGSRRCAGF